MSSTPETLDFVEEEFKEAEEWKEVSESSRIQFHAPLFHLISELQCEQHPLLAPFEITPLHDHTTFLIEITTARHQALFPVEEYQLIERHYRIDQYCKTNIGCQHGLTPIHYTEIYQCSAVTHEPAYIVAHGYLGARGQYLYTEIKFYQMDHKTLSAIQPTPAQTQRLAQILILNIHHSRDIIDALLAEKSQRYLKAKSMVDAQEQELSRLSQSLHVQGSLEQCIALCQQSIESIRCQNQYNDRPDSKGLLMHKSLPFLQKKLELLGRKMLSIKTSSPQEVQEETEEDNTHEVTIHPTAQGLLDTLLEETLDTLSGYVTTLKSNPITYPLVNPPQDVLSMICARHTLITEIEQELLAYLFIPENLLKEKKPALDSLYATLRHQTEHHNKSCMQILEIAARGGNVTTTQTLFPLFETQLPGTFYQNIIHTLLKCDQPLKRTNLMTICDYLHRYSAAYENTVLHMSNQTKCLLPPAQINTLKSQDIELTSVSLLYKAYLDNSLDVFDMLLKHGANPNSDFSHEKSLFTVLCYIVTLQLYDYSTYVQSLLNYGANPNWIQSEKGILSQNSKKIDNQILFKHTMQKSHSKTLQSCLAIKNVPIVSTISSAPIILVSNRRHSTLFKAMIPYADIENLACCLAFTATRDVFCFRRTTSKTPFVGFLSNPKNLTPITTPEAFPFLSLLLYPITTTNPTQREYIRIHSEHWELAHQSLIEKMNHPILTHTAFDNIYNSVFQMGINQTYETKFNDAYECFIACEILLAERCKSLMNHPIEQLELLKKHVPDLSENIINIFPRVYTEPCFAPCIRGWQLPFAVRQDACAKWSKHPSALTFSPAAPSSLPSASSPIPTETKEAPPVKKKGKPKPKKQN